MISSSWLERSPAMRAHCTSQKNPGRGKRPGGCGDDIFLLLLEVIVDAGAQQPEAVTVRQPGAGEVLVGEIDVEIFDLGAPVRGEAESGADTGGPARGGVGFRQAEGLGAQFAERQTAGAVEQNIVEGIAGAAAQRAEP